MLTPLAPKVILIIISQLYTSKHLSREENISPIIYLFFSRALLGHCNLSIDCKNDTSWDQSNINPTLYSHRYLSIFVMYKKHIHPWMDMYGYPSKLYPYIIPMAYRWYIQIYSYMMNISIIQMDIYLDLFRSYLERVFYVLLKKKVYFLY